MLCKTILPKIGVKMDSDKKLRLAIYFAVIMWVLDIKEAKGISARNLTTTDKSHQLLHNMKLLQKTDEAFQRNQVQAIKAYQKTDRKKRWECAYEDHVNAMRTLQKLTTREQINVIGLLEKTLKEVPTNVIIGAHEIANNTNDHFEFLLVWDEMYMNTLEYYNVLYGGKKIIHVPYGTTAPTSFFHMDEQDFLYYDLVSCLPYMKWLQRTKELVIKDTYAIPMNNFIMTRNAVNGIVAFLVNQTESSTTKEVSTSAEDNATERLMDRDLE